MLMRVMMVLMIMLMRAIMLMRVMEWWWIGGVCGVRATCVGGAAALRGDGWCWSTCAAAGSMTRGAIGALLWLEAWHRVGRVRGGRFGVLGCRVLAGWWARAFCLRLRACLLVFGLVSRVLRAMLSVAARVGWFVAAR